MNHFHFSSAAVDPTIAFYESYFGFPKVRTMGKTHVLEGEHGFLLAMDEAEASKPLGAAHLGFRLNTHEAVRSIYRRMKEEGVAITSELATPSPRASHFYCLDPSGQTIEVGFYDFSH